jgi:hypothetical protein
MITEKTPPFWVAFFLFDIFSQCTHAASPDRTLKANPEEQGGAGCHFRR